MMRPQKHNLPDEPQPNKSEYRGFVQKFIIKPIHKGHISSTNHQRQFKNLSNRVVEIHNENNQQAKNIIEETHPTKPSAYTNIEIVGGPTTIPEQQRIPVTSNSYTIVKSSDPLRKQYPHKEDIERYQAQVKVYTKIINEHIQTMHKIGIPQEVIDNFKTQYVCPSVTAERRAIYEIEQWLSCRNGLPIKMFLLDGARYSTSVNDPYDGRITVILPEFDDPKPEQVYKVFGGGFIRYYGKSPSDNHLWSLRYWHETNEPPKITEFPPKN